MVGRKLGSYEIIEEIGRGGMATVYRAHQPSIDRDVAIKVMHQSIANDPTAVSRFQREARLIARLEHIYLLPIYDFDGSHDPPYLVMRLLQTGTLYDVMRKRTATFAEIVHWFTQMGSALDYAHRQGVVHRDIKPSNIMIDQDSNAFVADFGIARLIKKDVNAKPPTSEKGMVVGTVNYMPPEQAQGLDIVDQRADIYALGVMLFQMVTGQLPFAGDTVVSTILAHMNDPVPVVTEFNSELPAEINHIIFKAMAKKPEERYTNVPALLNDLQDILELLPTDSIQTLSTATLLTQRLPKYPVSRTKTLAEPADPDPATKKQKTLTAQQKQVTILYANLAEYAEYVALADEEDEETPFPQLQAELEQIVASLGGIVALHNVNVLLAYWGVDVTHEDDPKRTVRAALQMQQTMRKFLEEDDEPLPMQIGITTGSVMLSPGGDVGGYRVSGVPLSLVNRLERVANTGTIVISHDTYRHVRSFFEVEMGTSLRLRGQAERVTTYLVVAEKERALRFNPRGMEGMETKMIGRQAELEQLQEAFIIATEEIETQVVTIVGEAGLGKSRLLYEFNQGRELAEATFEKLGGRATPEMQQSPYALLHNIFSGCFHIHSNDGPATMRSKFEEGMREFLPDKYDTQLTHFIGQLLGFDFTDSPYLQSVVFEGNNFRERAWQYLVQFFVNITATSPLLLQLEDIHWADESSLDFISHLVHQEPYLPLLIICLSRPALYESRAHWGSGGTAYIRLDLRPLSRRQCRLLVKELLQKASDIPTDLRDLLVNHAEGNPFYMEELLKVLLEDRVIQKEKTLWHVVLDRLAQVRVPTTLRGLIQSQLDGLFPVEQLLLQRASVLGQIFWLEGVQALGLPDEMPVDEEGVIQTLVDQQIIHRRAESTFAGIQEYVFSNKMLREVLYTSLSSRRRQTYHQQVANWLINSNGQRAEEYAGLIAEHLELAGAKVEVAFYLQQAGQRAMRQYANTEAIAYLTRALNFIPEENDETRYNLLLLREKMYRVQGTRQEQASDLKALEELAELLDEEDKASAQRWGEVALRQAKYAEETSAYEVAIGWIERGLAQLGQWETAEAAELRLILGLIKIRQGENEQALIACQQSLLIAGRLEETRVMARGYNLLGVIMRLRGENMEAIKSCQQSLELYQNINDQEGQGKVHNEMANVYFYLGQWRKANEHYHQAIYNFQQAGDIYNMVFTNNNMGGIALNQGRLEEALAYYQEAITGLKNVGGSLWMLGVFHNNLGATYIRQENITQAIQHLQTSQNYFQQTKTRDHLPELYRHFAEVALLQGSVVEAEKQGQEALTLARELNLRSDEGYTLRVLGEIALANRQWDVAKTFLKESLIILQEISEEYEWARTQLVMAQLQVERGDETQAIITLEQAEEIFRPLNARLDLKIGQQLRQKLQSSQ